MSFLLGLLLSVNASATPLLIETADLAGMDGVLAVDAREADAFAAGHIPGAAHLDVESLSETRAGVTGMLKPEGEVQALFAAAGLAPRRTIVVYSGMGDTGDLKRATRLFWALEYTGFPEVRLLNGGLSKWQAEGRPLETGASKVDPVEVEVLESLERVEERNATLDEAKSFQSGKKGVIADLRSSSEFSGTSKKDFIERGGHVPGAESLPAASFVEGPHATFKSPEIIAEMLDADSRGGAPVLTYCNTGRDASIGYVAYRLAGFDDVALYDGSMAEWGNRADCPIATGAGN